MIWDPPTDGTESGGIRLGRALIVIHLFLSPLLFQRGLIEGFEYPKAMLLTAVAILLSACLVLYQVGQTARLKDSPLKQKDEKKDQKKQKKSVRRGGGESAIDLFSDPISLGVILFLVSAFFSTIFSRSGITSFYGEHENFAGLITIASYTSLFFGTCFFCRGLNACRTVLIATVLSVVCMVIYGMVQAVGLDPFTWKRTASISNIIRIFGTIGHPNHLAAFLMMSFPIVCYFRLLAWNRRNIPAVAILIATEVSAAALVVFSFSRGAWLAMGVMLFVLLAGLIKINEKKWILFALLPWIIGLALGVMTFTALPKAVQEVSIEQLSLIHI